MNDQNPYAAPQSLPAQRLEALGKTLNHDSLVAVEFRLFLWGLRLLLVVLIFAGMLLIFRVQGTAVWIALLMLLTGSQILIATLPKKYAGKNCFLVAAGIQITLLVIAFLPEALVSSWWVFRTLKPDQILLVGEEISCLAVLLGFWLLAAEIRFSSLWLTSSLGIIFLSLTFLAAHTADRWMIVNPEGTAYELIFYGLMILVQLLLIFFLLLANAVLGLLIPLYVIRQRVRNPANDSI